MSTEQLLRACPHVPFLVSNGRLRHILGFLRSIHLLVRPIILVILQVLQRPVAIVRGRRTTLIRFPAPPSPTAALPTTLRVEFGVVYFAAVRREGRHHTAHGRRGPRAGLRDFSRKPTVLMKYHDLITP